MDNRKIATSSLVLFFLLNICYGDKLTVGQRAPLDALSSGGLLLAAPLVGNGAADVGRRSDVGRSGGAPKPPPPPKQNNPTPQVQPKEDGVSREETEELKEIDGHLVRVVKGSLGYDSPEGLPVSIKYTADENGNRASFTIGKPGGGGGPKAGGASGSGGGGKSTSNGGKNNNGGGGGGGTGGTGGGGKKTGGSGNGPSTYLPPKMMKVDNKYLPPS